MENDLLHIGPLIIYGYGLMIAIGIIAGYQVLITRAEKRLVRRTPISSLTLWGLFGGFLGAKLAGCCYGEETNGWLSITFHESELAPNGVKLIPTQIFESAFGFGIFFVLIYLAKRNRTDGFIASLYLLLYSLGRFIIEFYRGDIIRGNVGTLSTSQFISLLVFVVTCLILLMKSFQTMRHRSA
jgi:prolipoprotein diacylglyceryltransferase